MSRRLRSDAVLRLLKDLEIALRKASSSSEDDTTHLLDGKSLVVGGCSKDRDARWGRAAGCLAKGYKLHVVWGSAAVPAAWEILPLNVNEKRAAERLIGRLVGSGYLLADAQYDSNFLYDLAFEKSFRLLAPRHKRGGFGHHYLSPHRRLAVMLLEQAGYSGEFRRRRNAIERRFGNLTSFAGGLAPLPSWVRHLPRVQLWVQAKLLINAIRTISAKPAVA